MNYTTAIDKYLQIGDYNSAHRILCEHVAPLYLCEKLEDKIWFATVMNVLEKNQQSIHKWGSNGALIWTVMHRNDLPDVTVYDKSLLRDLLSQKPEAGNRQLENVMNTEMAYRVDLQSRI